MNKVSERLQELADLHEARNSNYDNAYKKHGAVMDALFPNGMILDSVEAHGRFGVLTLVVGKLVRYAGNFERSGHDDSLDDLSVYSQMLRELDQEARMIEKSQSLGGRFTGMSQEEAERQVAASFSTAKERAEATIKAPKIKINPDPKDYDWDGPTAGEVRPEKEVVVAATTLDTSLLPPSERAPTYPPQAARVIADGWQGSPNWGAPGRAPTPPRGGSSEGGAE